MNHDFLDQLADFDVPPPPAQFGEELHVRREPLAGASAADRVAVRGLPLALWELARALGGWAAVYLERQVRLEQARNEVSSHFRTGSGRGDVRRGPPAGSPFSRKERVMPTNPADAADLSIVDTTKDALSNSFGEAATQLFSLAPRVIAMVAVLVIGYIVARLVARVVILLSEKLGLQTAAERSGLAESMAHTDIGRNVPAIIGTIVFWLMMCVFIMAAFNILGLGNGLRSHVKRWSTTFRTCWCHGRGRGRACWRPASSAAWWPPVPTASACPMPSTWPTVATTCWPC